jgi:hypothetical protein
MAKTNDPERVFFRSLNYRTGLARIQWADGDTRYQQRAFMSRADNVLVLQLAASGKKKLSGSVGLEEGNHGLGRRLQDIRKPNAEGQWLSCRFGFTLNEGGYEVLALVSADGSVTAADAAVRFDDASSVTVLLRIQPLTDYDASQMDAMKQELARYCREDFDTLLARHAKIHGGLYGRVKIEELSWSPEKVKVRLRSPTDQELTLRVKSGDGWQTATARLSAAQPATYTFEGNL